MKTKYIIVAACLLLTSLLFVPAFAEEQEIKPSASQVSAIKENCSTIRQNLKNLQHTDSRARTYFGAIYETFASKYLKPLNLRLINNDLSSPELSKLQTTFATTRTSFSNDFIDYSKSLEELIVTDCRLEPEIFYQRLVKTRTKRSAVAKDVKTLNKLLVDSIKNVEKLKESLHE